MLATVVMFQRTAKDEREGKWEYGIGISLEDEAAQLEIIVDHQGKTVQDVWKYRDLPYRGCFVTDLK